MSETSAKKTPFWIDALLLAVELAARQVYWRLPRLRAWVKRRRAGRRRTPQTADREELKKHLRSIGVTEGTLVMAHTSTSGLSLTERSVSARKPTNSLLVARQLLDDLLELVGESGTLVMPTHALYQHDNQGVRSEDLARPVVYDPTSTPCGVGLANELFWRRKGVQRSLHPYNTLAACGPLATELLHDNLNDAKPLAHGVHSAYYRFCLHDGLIISVGVPLGRYMTLVHTAEDVRDREWQVPGFFEEKRYLVRAEGREKEWTVRQSRPVYRMFSLCMRKFIRDLLREGILHEGAVGSVRVDWAHAREVFEFLMQRNRLSPYPYYGSWLVKTRK